MKFLTAVFALTALAYSARAYVDDEMDFTNYAVLGVVPQSSEQIDFLQFLEAEKSISLKLDFWNPVKNNSVTSVGVPPESIKEFQEILAENGIYYFVSVENLKQRIVAELEENQMQHRDFSKASNFATDQYHQYSEISIYVKQLAKDYPNLVKVEVLGNTVENREILDVRVGLNSNEQKPVIIIDSGIHAREWVSPATSLYIINELVSKQNTDTEIASLLNKFDWHFIPVANPDGYAYTWTSNRLWRKNRSRSNNGCYGADPNRNFQVGFGGQSTSSNPCSDLYPGVSAFSEAESRAIKQLTEKYASRLKAALTLHSFGQMWMSPWGYVSQRPKDYNTMLSAAKTATAALRSVSGTSYAVGSIYEVIYPTGGGSTDWQYQATGCPYVYAIELRDKGIYGFQLPRSLIIPTATETWAGIKALAQII